MTPPDVRVSRVIAQTVQRHFANPSAIHADGVAARRALADSRAKIATCLNAQPDEIMFAATGTEANNLAIFGVFKKLVMPQSLGGYGLKPNDLHCLVSEIEHASVLECVRHLSEVGVRVEYLPIDASGRVDLTEIRKKISPNTFLVSVMSVNNEIGTIQPIDEVARVVRKARKDNTLAQKIGGDTPHFPLLHCDASQSPLYMKLSTPGFGADLITLDSHKVYGPRSVGVLWVRRGIELMPILYGGGQERRLRSGTENVPGVAGMAKALELAEGLREREVARLTKLRNYFIVRLQEMLAERMPHVRMFLNGADEFGSQCQSPHIVSVSFESIDPAMTSGGVVPPIDHEFLLLKLDARGVACSTKSACLRDEDESYVIRALRRAQTAANTAGTLSASAVPKTPHALRFSFGRWTTKRDLDRTITALVESLRSI